MKAQVAVRAELSASAGFRAWYMVGGGYAAATLGLLLDLPTIGSSGTSAVVTIGIGLLIAIGILLAAAGMLQLRRAVARGQVDARRGLGMQGLGLVLLLVGVLGLQISPALPVLLGVGIFVFAALALVMVGGWKVRRHYSILGVRKAKDVSYLVVGTALVFIGVFVILGSKIGYYFLFPDVTSTVVNDVGAAISASGCVVATYSSFLLRRSAPSLRRTKSSMHAVTSFQPVSSMKSQP